MKNILSLQKEIAIAMTFLLTACASVVPKGQTPDSDPFEYTNRKIFTFNKSLDDHVIKPLAKGYRSITSDGVRKSVRNVYANIHEIPTAVNDIFQWDPASAGRDISRLGINSTVGVLGLFDVASSMGIKKNYNTFGKTLSKWGITYSPYIVMPVIGPSTVRDSFGRIVDNQLNPVMRYGSTEVKIPYYLLYGVSVRESLLDSDELRGVVSFDDYIFIRNAYLQRQGMILPDPTGGIAPDEFDGDF